MSNDVILLNSLLEQQKLEVAPEMRDDDYLEIFVNEQILKNYELSYDEMLKGIVDNGGDGGIDGIHIFINGELLQEDTELNIFKKDIKFDIFIIQSKNQSGFHEDAILKMFSSAKDLFDLTTEIESFNSRYNKELIKIIKRFRNSFMQLQSKFPVLNFKYYYATKGDEVHPNVLGKVILIEEEIKNKFSNSNFKFEFLTARNLIDLARTTQSSTYFLKCSETISTTDFGYMCLVKLKDYFNFIVDDNKRIIKPLFDANVRDYQGSIAVNSCIKDTLESSLGNQNFWWLNNGVTITVDRANMAGNVLTIEEPQVVNGCQTSFEIYNYISNIDDIKDEERKVLVKVIQVPSEEIRMNIIRANNSQTQIPLSSLRATDDIHRDIEEHLKINGFYYERRKNYYKNMGKPIFNIISVGYLSQIIEAIILGKPDVSRSRPSTLLKKDEDYKKIFNKKYSLNLYLNGVKIARRIETIMKEIGIQAGDILNLKYHTMMFVVMYKNKWERVSAKKFEEFDTNSISDDEIKEVIIIVKEIFESLGGSDKIAKGSKFVDAVKDRLKNLIEEN